MSTPSVRPKPREAPPELLVLARFEEFCAWLLAATPRWPKRARFTLTRRIEEHALEVLEELVQARYERNGRAARLARVNLVLERMRRLLRLAQLTQVCSAAQFESACRGLDEVGRMLHGWRTSLGERPRPAPGEERVE